MKPTPSYVRGLRDISNLKTKEERRENIKSQGRKPWKSVASVIALGAIYPALQYLSVEEVISDWSTKLYFALGLAGFAYVVFDYAKHIGDIKNLEEEARNLQKTQLRYNKRRLEDKIK